MPIRDVDGSRQDPPVLWKKHVCWAAESCAGVKSRSGEARERKELLKKGLYVSTQSGARQRRSRPIVVFVATSTGEW